MARRKQHDTHTPKISRRSHRCAVGKEVVACRKEIGAEVNRALLADRVAVSVKEDPREAPQIDGGVLGVAPDVVGVAAFVAEAQLAANDVGSVGQRLGLKSVGVAL